jgi:hypothetical protein
MEYPREYISSAMDISKQTKYKAQSKARHKTSRKKRMDTKKNIKPPVNCTKDKRTIRLVVLIRMPPPRANTKLGKWGTYTDDTQTKT